MVCMTLLIFCITWSGVSATLKTYISAVKTGLFKYNRVTFKRYLSFYMLNIMLGVCIFVEITVFIIVCIICELSIVFYHISFQIKSNSNQIKFYLKSEMYI